MEVRLEPEPMDKRIQPGMFASLKITTQRKNDVIVIPDSCILSSDQEYWVYVINENNSAKKRIIKTGLSSLGFTEITEGLIEGETIVSRGQNLLSDGVTVNIVEIKE
jgi:multidrug efflux pump subunit AcrA (membrane-fusion protein)